MNWCCDWSSMDYWHRCRHVDVRGMRSNVANWCMRIDVYLWHMWWYMDWGSVDSEMDWWGIRSNMDGR